MPIHIKKSHKGLLHKHLGIPQGQKIPTSKLTIKSTDSEKVRKQKQFALNASHWAKKAKGGYVENYFYNPFDPLNNPEQYQIAANGGKLNPNQLSIGTEIEKEHNNTLKGVINDAKKGNTKPLKSYYRNIAKDHLKEIDNYYTGLSKMEKEYKKANGGNLPLYDFGSWLGKNAVPLISTAGGIASEVVAPGNPMGIGMIASGVGGLASNNLGNQATLQNNGLPVNTGNAPQPMQSPYAAYGGNLTMYNNGGNPLINYKGNPHSKGGIKLGNLAEVEDKETSFKFNDKGGSNNSGYVFSHQLKSNGGNMSYADESKKIMNPYLNKNKELKRPFDSISQSTIEQKMRNLKNRQEEHRTELGLTEPTGNNAYGSYMDNNPYYSGRMPKLFAYGNNLPKYADGDALPTYNDKVKEMSSEEYQNYINNITSNSSLNKPFQPSLNPSLSNPNRYSRNLGLKTTNGGINPYGGDNNSPVSNLTPVNTENPYMQGIAIGSQLLPSIYGLTKNKQLPVNYQRVTPETLKYNANLSSTIGGINKSYAGLNQDLRNTEGGSGSYLASRIASGASQAGDVGSTTAKTIENYDNMNAQNRMQANQINAGIQHNEVDSRAAEHDRYISGQQKNLQNIGTVIGGVGRDDSYRDSEMYYDKSGVLQRGRPKPGYAKGGYLKHFKKNHKTSRYSRTGPYVNN